MGFTLSGFRFSSPEGRNRLSALACGKAYLLICRRHLQQMIDYEHLNV
jgi:hypothetical protein